MGGLVVRDISVRFGGLAALERVSFTVPPRTVVGVIGPNGAGKTTLFNVVCGFVRPTNGSLTWDDEPLRPVPERLAGLGVARTLQAVRLFPRLTALQNVMVGATRSRRAGFAAAVLALPRSDADERRLRDEALTLLERLEVADVADRPAATLPHAVAKRVALARALACRPRLLMLDEPAGGLGAEDIRWLAGVIRALPVDPATPCSVLLVEHHMDLVTDVCDTVVVLDFGRVIASGPPQQVRSDPAVVTAYLGAEVPDTDGTGARGTDAGARA